MAAARVSFTWFGVAEEDADPRAEGPGPPEAFDAEGQYLSAGKEADRHEARRLPRRHGDPRNKVDSVLEGTGRCPTRSPSVRLDPAGHDVVESFAAQMADFRAELDDAVANLDRHYAELKQAAREATLGGLFKPVGLSRDRGRPLRRRRGTSPTCPSPPSDYLVQLSPGALRGRRRARGSPPGSRRGRAAGRAGVRGRVRPGWSPTSADRMAGTGEDGQPRVFRDSAIANLTDFFGRFGRKC